MAKDWKGELKDIITSQQKSIKQVIDDREKREAERLKKIDEICKRRKKTRRIVFFEAFQSYISLFEEGKV